MIMAYGMELILGFIQPKWQIAEEGLGLQIRRPIPSDPDFGKFQASYRIGVSEEEQLSEFWLWCEVDDYDDLLVPNKRLTQINEALLKVHALCCQDMGFTFENTAKNLWDTPLGVRELYPFSLEFQFDPSEAEDFPYNAILGVSISGRYRPTFLDWREPHGTLHNQVVGPNPVPEMEFARKRLIQVFPVFEQADWIMRERHY